jgi:hypothetical protein
LLREHTGTSAAFRAAVAREIQHFTEELSDYVMLQLRLPRTVSTMQAEAMVKLVFSAGAEALDSDKSSVAEIAKRVKIQLRFIQLGAVQYSLG